MAEEKTASPSLLTTLARCCRPSRLLGMSGILLAAALMVLYLAWGRQWLAVHQEASGEAEQKLLSIVDVFSCCILTWRALTVMLPAFVLAAAIATFAPTPVVLRYLGSQSHKVTAYTIAALTGMVLSLCSCNVVPLFVSIKRRGAGVGPAFTFLFSGPAINVVAMIFTFQVIGFRLGLWRVIGVPIIGITVGLLMARLFPESAAAPEAAKGAAQYAGVGGSFRRVWLLLFLLLAMVVYGAQTMALPLQIAGMAVLVAGAVALLAAKFDRDEVRALGRETWLTVRLVVPVLLPAVLIIGAIAAFIDVKLVYRLVGTVPENAGIWGQLRPIAIAAVSTKLMYFPILTEVAFTKAFLKLGMGVGPALAILLTGPGTSLPGMILIGRSIGWTKAIAYEALVVLATVAYAGLFAGEIGRYICACMTK